MKQSNCENHWRINNARCELEHVDQKAINELGVNNPISKRIKSIRKNMENLGELCLQHGLDVSV